MNKKGLIWTVIIWIILTIVNYYYMPFFFLAFIWLGLSLGLSGITIVQFVKLIKEKKELKKLRVAKFIIFLMLFLLTFYRSTTNLVIEKMDWLLLENRRIKIVKQVVDKELNRNVGNVWVYELPFEFPVVSNGGNDLLIHKNKENGKIIVSFWVFRNFFDSPSTCFVYTDDPKAIKSIEKKIAKDPDHNWKIKENWYREYGD